MYRKPSDAGAGSGSVKTGDKTKPKVAIKRTGSAGATGTAGNGSASAAAGGVNGAATAATGVRKRPTKLRPTRERRARDRSMDDDEDLEHKFSNLSFTAPAFVPGKPFASAGAASAPSLSVSTNARGGAPKQAPLLQGRSLAFVTERAASGKSSTPGAASSNLVETGTGFGSTKRTSPPRRVQTAETSSAAPSLRSLVSASESQSQEKSPSIGRPNIERRPRRQRIGAMGFSKSSVPGGMQGRVTRQSNAGSGPSLSLKLRLTDDAVSSSSTASSLSPSSSVGGASSAFQQRPRSDSAGSDSDYGSDDEVYPEDQGGGASSAFPDRLTLFSQQKRIPKKVSRDVVIDTIFEALFTKKQSSDNRARGYSAFGDDTGTDNEDEPNEEFVKRGLAASLFKDNVLGGSIRLFTQRGNETQQEAVDRFITPALVHTLVTDMRFEDFRTASARIDILRAIHKNFPSKRLHIARALADATALRLGYVTALLRKAHALSIEKSQAIVDNKNDHGHGFTELLRYAIEHVGESLNGFPTGGSGGSVTLSEAEVKEILRNYMLSLICLWRAHWLDPAGSDDEELISCAGQFVSYMPEVTVPLLQRLLANWPRKYPSQEVVAIRMVARVVMSSPPLHSLDDSGKLHLQLFTRLAQSVQSPHTQVAQEALAFTGCQFAMVHFLGRYEEVYKVVTEAFHANAVGHWNEAVRTTSESHFDRALDYAL